MFSSRIFNLVFVILHLNVLTNLNVICHENNEKRIQKSNKLIKKSSFTDIALHNRRKRFEKLEFDQIQNGGQIFPSEEKKTTSRPVIKRGISKNRQGSMTLERYIPKDMLRISKENITKNKMILAASTHYNQRQLENVELLQQQEREKNSAKENLTYPYQTNNKEKIYNKKDNLPEISKRVARSARVYIYAKVKVGKTRSVLSIIALVGIFVIMVVLFLCYWHKILCKSWNL
uniref:Uncharacterized protein n=1 Tax=Clytia hemisphaerica TaxID=252671 RepID=A0A7M5X1G7_9CNID